MADNDLSQAFLAGRIDPARFSHLQHLQVAHELLGELSFLEALSAYAGGLRALTEAAGVPEKFNLTLTLGFLSLIAERMAAKPDAAFHDFLARNADLLDSGLMDRFYARNRLNSDLARRIFVLPIPA